MLMMSEFFESVNAYREAMRVHAGLEREAAPLGGMPQVAPVQSPG